MSKINILENYIKENTTSDGIEQIEKEVSRDTYVRAIAHLHKIEKEFFKIAKPLQNVKRMLDDLPPWVERLITPDNWEYIQDIHDLSKTNIHALVVNAFGDLEGHKQFKSIDNKEREPSTADLVSSEPPREPVKELNINLEEFDIDIIGDIIVDEINAAFNDLPDDSPFKNRENALIAMKKMKNLVSEDIQITLQDLRDAVSTRLAGGGEVSDREKETLLNNFSQEELEAAGITFDVVDDQDKEPDA